MFRLQLITYFLFMYALMTWTYGIGAPTGLFVPSLAVGAAGGQIVGRVVRAMVMSTGSDIVVDLHAYAVMGAASMLGGTTRMTISITVLVMETTGSMQLIIPLMITIFFAKNIGDRYSMGIYDTHIKIRGGECIFILIWAIRLTACFVYSSVFERARIRRRRCGQAEGG